MRPAWLAVLFAGVLPAVAGPSMALDGHEEYVYEIAFSSDGRLMATASGDNTAIVWDTATWRKLHVLEHEAAVYSARISPDGKALATGCGDGQVTLWNPSNGQRIRQVRRHADAVYAVAFSPDGRLLASAGGSTDGGDAACRILSARSLETEKELTGHERQVYGLVFSPDGTTLASGSSDKTVRLWNVESGEARVWRGHASDVYRGAFSPDGNRFATPSQDGTVRLWAVDTGKVVGVFESKPKDPFYTVAFSPDGSLLAAVGDDRRLRFLRAPDLRPESDHELSDHALYAVVFHPKTCLPVAAGEDGKVYPDPRPR